MKYLVTFKYTSFYEDEKENKIAKDTLEYEAKNLDELWKILEEEDYNDDIVVNFKAKSNLNVIEHDEEKIVDVNNEVVWKEKL